MALAVSFSGPIAQQRCQRREAELWALAFASGSVFFVRRPGGSAAEFIAALAGPALGATEPEIGSFLRCADRLDMVEFIAELEEARQWHLRRAP
jgi:hypothetical protein